MDAADGLSIGGSRSGCQRQKKAWPQGQQHNPERLGFLALKGGELTRKVDGVQKGHPHHAVLAGGHLGGNRTTEFEAQVRGNPARRPTGASHCEPPCRGPLQDPGHHPVPQPSESLDVESP